MTRQELQAKYFLGLPLSTPNMPLISLLSDTQEVLEHYIPDDSPRNIEVKQHYIQLLNEIKRVLIKDEEKFYD